MSVAGEGGLEKGHFEFERLGPRHSSIGVGKIKLAIFMLCIAMQGTPRKKSYYVPLRGGVPIRPYNLL